MRENSHDLAHQKPTTCQFYDSSLSAVNANKLLEHNNSKQTQPYDMLDTQSSIKLEAFPAQFDNECKKEQGETDYTRQFKNISKVSQFVDLF